MMNIKEVLLQWFRNFFDKKTLGQTVKNENISNITITNAFQKILKESNHKPNKIKATNFMIDQ